VRKRQTAPFSLFSFQDIITSVTGIVILIALLLAIEVVYQRAASPTGRRQLLVRESESALQDAQQQIAAIEARLAGESSLLDELASAIPERMAEEDAELQKRSEELRREIQALEKADSRQQGEVQAAQTRDFDRRAERTRAAALQAEVDRLNQERKSVREGGRLFFRETQGSKRAWLTEISPQAIHCAAIDDPANPLLFKDATAAQRVKALLAFARRRQANREYFVLFLKPGTEEQFEAVSEGLEKQGFEFGFDLLGENQTVVPPKDSP